jgi:hypothetical protein
LMKGECFYVQRRGVGWGDAAVGRESLWFAGLRLEDLEADPKTIAPR